MESEERPIDLTNNDDNDVHTGNKEETYPIISREYKQQPIGGKENPLAFRYKNHSLSINASSVAACVGYHEFQSIPELMVQHVYQGREGQALLQHDARLLGLTLVSEQEDEEELMRLAETTGSVEVQTSLKRALKLKHGDPIEQNRVRSVDDANKLKASLERPSEELLRILTPQQLTALKNGIRQAVDTGCGRSWEDEALDRYQEQCGWDVRERNAECRHWHFEKTQGRSNHSPTATIRPIAPAFVKSPCQKDACDSMSGRKRKLSESGDISRKADDTTMRCSPKLDEHLKPFLIIKGMVDGIRDEWGPTNGNNVDHSESKSDRANDSDDDSAYGDFSLSRVVVECKHRMNSLLPNGPRFSECIQAVVYCFMYETDDADIVQVLRAKPKTKQLSTKSWVAKTSTASDSNKPQRVQQRQFLTNYFHPSNTDSTEKDIDTIQKKDGSIPTSTALSKESSPIEDRNKGMKPEQKLLIRGHLPNPPSSAPQSVMEKEHSTIREGEKSPIDLQLSVHRVSLDDPNFCHRHNWNETVLPKLRQWVDAVYTIRQSDDKRYRLLSTVSSMMGNIDDDGRKDSVRAAWELVFQECDFLRDGMSGERYRRELK